MAQRAFFTFLAEAGGNHIANVDGSVTPVEFLYTSSAYREVHRMVVRIQDNGVPSANDYGAVNGPLANGVMVYTRDRNGNDTALTEFPVQSNVDWGKYCYDVTEHTFGAGDNFILVRWTFSRAGSPIRLRPQESLVAVIQDDLTGLTSHTFHVQGRSG